MRLGMPRSDGCGSRSDPEGEPPRSVRLQEPSALQTIGKRLSSLALSGLLAFAPLSPAVASEFDVLADDVPAGYLIDDAGILNAVTKGQINAELKSLENATGYKVVVITLRKLEYDPDAFSFADKIVEKWYPTAELGDKKGVLLVVTAAKEGAVSGGPSFMNTIGDNLIDGIVNDNIPIFSEEKYNEAVTSSLRRIEAVLQGKEDPGGPERKDNTRRRTYRTKEETDKSKTVTTTVVATLLLIAFVVPMLQFYGYVSRD